MQNVTGKPFYLKVGDTNTPIRLKLLDEGEPVDLSNAATISFIAKRGNTVKFTGVMTKDADQTLNKGVVEYAPTGTDVNTPGEFDKSVVKIVWTNGKTDTFPRGEQQYLKLIIQE